MREDDSPGQSESEDSEAAAKLPLVQLNSRFYGSIELGNPPQSEEVIYDTGSDVAWVYHKDCKHCANRLKYDPALSQTNRNRDRDFTIQYGTGGVYGIVSRDTLGLGPLSVKNTRFAEASQMLDMDYDAFDGIIGLGFPLLSIDQVSSCGSRTYDWLPPRAGVGQPGGRPGV